MRAILIIIPYDPIYPPLNGGMLRCFHILHQLALYFRVTAIINQPLADFNSSMDKYPALRSVRIYSTAEQHEKTDVFSVLPKRVKNALRYRWYKRNFTGTTDSNFLKYYPLLKKALGETKFDAVVLENLDTLNAVSVIRDYTKDTSIFYDAHNVDSSLNANQGSATARAVLAAEKVLHKNVNGIFACSETDLEQLRRLNGQKLNGVVIPNGVWLEKKLYDGAVQDSANRSIIFCGSLNYAPNAEGMEWFSHEVWPKLVKLVPAVKLLVVGGGKVPATPEHACKDQAVIFTGRVEDVKLFYEQACVAVVPLQTGSGTRLKVLEAMGLGLPVVSTSKGAEGIQYTNGKNILIADEGEEFAKQVALLLADKNRRLTIRSAARELAETLYDWNIIGAKMEAYLEQEISAGEKVV